jgi:LmbE family N-acetylglucosaminyl deacetylase
MRDNFIRWAYKNIFSGSVRNSLKAALLLTEHDRQPSPIIDFSEAKILVLAPHMDDEAIGCGGAVILHSMQGAEITIAYMTDGKLGDVRLLDGSLHKNDFAELQKSLIKTRQKEAKNCAKILGAGKLLFFDAEDGSLRPDDLLVNKLTEVLVDESPDVIYLPFLMDSHEDHWQTNCLLYKCLKNIPDKLPPSIICRCYEVWSPLVANRFADISSVVALKVDALNEHRSQLNDVDYVSCIKGLNKYRAIRLKGGRGYCEAFFECSLTEYKELFERLV